MSTYPVTTLPTGDYGTARWADESENIVEPSDGQKDAGFASGERPAPPTLNWLHYVAYLWIALLDAVIRAQRVWRIECWDFVTANATSHGWTFTGGGLTETIEDPTSLMRHRFLKIAGSASASTTGYADGEYFHYFTDDSDVMIEFDIAYTAHTSSNFRYEVSLNFSTSFDSLKVAIRHDDSTAKWYLGVYDSLGSSTGTDAASVDATADQVYRMRLEYSGANKTGAGQARIRLYIDGVLECEITGVAVPVNDKGKISIRSSNFDAGDANGHLYIGPIAISAEAGVTA